MLQCLHTITQFIFQISTFLPHHLHTIFLPGFKIKFAGEGTEMLVYPHHHYIYFNLA